MADLPPDRLRSHDVARAPLRVLSLGAGVQSTTMALMAAHGELTPMPDCAIFADTQDEPAAVYEHLRWLMSPNVLPFPIHVVTAGKLSERMLGCDDEARIPFFVKAGGISKRQCTRNYKLRPIRRKVRELLGVPRGYIKPGAAEVWVGISTDEASRIKPSGVSYLVNQHPLIDNLMSRSDCKGWLLRNDYPIPPKSACKYCPFMSDEQRRVQKIESPSEFADACRIDRALREPEQVKRFSGELFVHPSCVPLDQVDFSSWQERGQPDLFQNECEGMCGV